MGMECVSGAGLLPFARDNAPGCEATQCDDRPRAAEVEADRLGSGGVLPSREGVQRAGGVEVSIFVCVCVCVLKRERVVGMEWEEALMA